VPPSLLPDMTARRVQRQTRIGTPPIPVARHFPSPLGEGGRRPDEGDSFCTYLGLPLTLPLSQGRGKAPRRTKSRKLILPPFDPWETSLGFRDGRHELSHLCPEASGACPRVGCDTPKLRQGVRPGRGALNDRPHLPDALESGWRQPGKTPRTGCRRCHVFPINPMSTLAGIPFPPILRRNRARRRRAVRVSICHP